MPGGTPYITPAMLTSKPAGLSWTVVPTLTAPGAEQAAQLGQVCWSATSYVDTYCRQPLRATIATEQGSGPGVPRIGVDRTTGITTLVTRQWPVTAVEAIQVSPAASFPPVWTLIPAGQYRVKNPPVLSAGPVPAQGPSGGNTVEVAPCWITWDLGRGGWLVSHSYAAGWPHAGLTGTGCEEDVSTLDVDDVTGWAGVGGFIYDGPFTEPVEVVSVEADDPVTLPGIGGTVQAGPGTITLSSPTTFGHEAGTVVSALPSNVLHGAALAAAVEALETIDAIATQSLNGQMAGGTGALAEQAEMLLDDFRRVM